MDAQYRYIEDFRHDRLSDIDDDLAIQRTSRRIYIIVMYALNQSEGIHEYKFRISNPKGNHMTNECDCKARQILIAGNLRPANEHEQTKYCNRSNQ